MLEHARLVRPAHFSLDPGKFMWRFQGTPRCDSASDFFRRRRRFHVAHPGLKKIKNAYSALCARS